ncbi:MAG: two-component sensor histidine kinase [Gammaproteobacteria bacterium]|nr:MAG: two-component sensor histidine kinase [Gammaproteobacteria bacterium]
MDGRQNTLVKSLQFQLSASISIAVTVVALIASVFSYWWSFNEAIELQDEQLRRLSSLVNDQRISQITPAKPIYKSSVDPESDFIVQWLDSSSSQQKFEIPGLPHNLPDGLQTQTVNGVGWRLLIEKQEDGTRSLVAQQTEVRDEIARISALNTLIPLLILIPILSLLIAYLIRQVFLPLKKMSAQLNNKNNQDLQPLPQQNLANEIAPFVTAINHLLDRVRHSMMLQRQFVRDAAHELRSPLTAISLQAERLIDANGNPDIQPRLINLHKATERTRILIEQLLTMARVQEEHSANKTIISVKALLREVVEDLLPLANFKSIDLSVDGDDIEINSQSIDLHILIKNLIENAIRYTPNQGKVEIFIIKNDGYVELIVKDSGPGIPEDEMQRVFDPFYRVLGNNEPGSGLGLSIVKTIANRLGLGLKMYNNSNESGSGLSIRVSFKTNPI